MDNQPAFDWQHFLGLAGEWYANPAMTQYAEALYRSISSRAYYAAYHAAEEVAIQLGMETTASASDHYRVRHFYTNRGRLANQLSTLLRDLYRLRIDIELMGCPTICNHCWAQGVPYAAMPLADVTWVLRELDRFFHKRQGGGGDRMG